MTVLMIATALLVLALDVGTKVLAVNGLGAQSLTAIPGLLELRLSYNDGIALGMMSGQSFAILLLPLAVVAGGWFLLRRYVSTYFTRAAIGLVLGGFLGNFLERLWHGYVTDMIFFPFMPWFICNIADITICIGVCLLMISLLFRPGDWREKNAKDDSPC
ncbi:MAG: signal peptidase II [Eubacteriales bacterium]|nr:signal peptidase II [Eubacteriales bacterium]